MYVFMPLHEVVMKITGCLKKNKSQCPHYSRELPEIIACQVRCIFSTSELKIGVLSRRDRRNLDSSDYERPD